jgi:hypothetical protein
MHVQHLCVFPLCIKQEKQNTVVRCPGLQLALLAGRRMLRSRAVEINSVTSYRGKKFYLLRVDTSRWQYILT